MRNPVNIVTSVAVEPTAPRDRDPANCPITAISAILKSTCSRLDSISGTLKISIFFPKDPSVRSCIFCFILLLSFSLLLTCFQLQSSPPASTLTKRTVKKLFCSLTVPYSSISFLCLPYFFSIFFCYIYLLFFCCITLPLCLNFSRHRTAYGCSCKRP